MEEDKLLCMLCCCNYEKDKNSNLGTVIRFKKFCKELECFLKERSGGGGKVGKAGKAELTKRRLKGDLNLAYGNLSICPNCLKLICDAVKVREEAGDLEESVRSLQKQVLELMEELNGRMERFLGEMRGIEKVVKESDEERLWEYLEENLEAGLKNDAVLFRERILEAVEDLQVFRGELTVKLNCQPVTKTKNSKSKWSSKRYRSRNKSQQTDDTLFHEDSQIINPKDEAPAASSTNVKIEIDPDLDLEKAEVNQFLEENYDDSVNYDNDNFDDDNFEDNNVEDNNFKEIEEEPERDNKPVPDIPELEPSPPLKKPIARKRPRRSVTKRRKCAPSPLPCPEDDDLEDKDDDKDDDFQISDLDDDEDEEDNVSEAGSNFSDVDTEALKLKTPKKKRAKRHSKKTLNLSELSDFKRIMVTWVLGRLDRKAPDPDEDEPEDNNIQQDPRDKYLVQYHHDSGTLILENIEIICNDQEKYVQCSACNYKKGGVGNKEGISSRLIRRIHDHILGRHLDAFKCSQCEHRSSNYKTFMSHIASHSQAVICDVCGRPLQNKNYLRTHKWLHLNDLEKAEAIKNGQTDPTKAYFERKKKPKDYSCSTCGKRYRTPYEVKNHEIIHGERDKVPCHLCGKLLMNSGPSFKHHEKYACPGLEKTYEARECKMCDKVFKNMSSLKSHMFIAHPVKPLTMYYCDQCGRSFNIKSNLKNHIKEVHTEVRAWSCEKCGGGASFKNKRNLLRHQKTCQGLGAGGGGGRKRSNGAGEGGGNTSFFQQAVRGQWGEEPLELKVQSGEKGSSSSEFQASNLNQVPVSGSSKMAANF